MVKIKRIPPNLKIVIILLLVNLIFLMTKAWALNPLSDFIHFSKATQREHYQGTRVTACSYQSLFHLALAKEFPAILENNVSSFFQFTGSPLAANWVKGNDIYAYNLANKVSANVNGFYTPASGSLISAYSSLLYSLAPNEASRRAISEFNNVKYHSNYLKLDGEIVSLPTISIDGDLGKDLALWQKYLPDEYDVDITISNIPQVTFFSDGLDTLPTLKRCKYDFNSEHDTKTEKNAIERYYKFRVKIKGFRSYFITFGGWFSAPMANFQNKHVPAMSASNQKLFFGKKHGSLHVIPSQVWVIYQPKVELTLNKDFYDKLNVQRSKLDLNLRHTLGGVTSSLKKNSEQENNNNITLTYVSPTLQGPIILGVTSIKNFIDE